MMENMSANPREAALRAIRTLQRYWLAALCLPVAYVLVCAATQRYVFDSGDSRGFFPQGEESALILLVFFAILAMLAQVLVLVLKQRFATWLDESAEEIGEFIRILRRRFLILGTICDTVSGLGLIYFLLNGDMRVMLGLGAASYVLYAQIYTLEQWADKIQRGAFQGNGSRPSV